MTLMKLKAHSMPRRGIHAHQAPVAKAGKVTCGPQVWPHLGVSGTHKLIRSHFSEGSDMGGTNRQNSFSPKLSPQPNLKVITSHKAEQKSKNILGETWSVPCYRQSSGSLPL